MPATLITLIGPVIASELISDLPIVLERQFAGASEHVIPTVPSNALAISDLTTRQWRTTFDQAEVRAALTGFIDRARAGGVDVLLTPAHLTDPGPRLVVTDVDSTLIQDEVIELLAEHAGSRIDVARVTEAAMRGELDFTESLLQRVATLKGLPTSVFDEVTRALRLSAGVENMCRTLKANGDYVGVVSGGFIEIVEPLAKDLGIDFARANRLTVRDGQLTGEVTGTIVDREVKAQTLHEWAQECGVPLTRTIAIGDGANDLSMLAAAGLGVAFNAKPVVQEQADTAITNPRIDTVLAVLGS